MNPKKITIASWNVNGIRACIKNGFWDWYDRSAPDIACLQESKITAKDFEILKDDHELTALIPAEDTQTDLFGNKKNPPPKKRDHPIYFAIACAEKPGYSGTLLLSKIKPNKVEIGLGEKKFDREGRTIMAYYDNFVLLNCYFPNGGPELDRIPYKMEYNEFLLDYLQKLRKQHKNIIITGDFNVAHSEIDIKNAKANEGSSGFTQVERDWFTKLLAHKYVDTFRSLNPEARDVYSWWSYRAAARQRNVGWRIDYFVVTEEMKKQVTDARVEMKQMGSDHCPVWISVEM